MPLMNREEAMHAIPNAVKQWNIKTSQPANYDQVKDKIVGDCGVKSETADAYLRDLVKTNKLGFNLGGLWHPDVNK